MDEKEFIGRVDRQVSNIAFGYRQAKKRGMAPKVVSVPHFESQADFDAYRPEDAGNDFREENRFVELVVEGLQKKEGMPTQSVTVRKEHFTKWLAGRPITSEIRTQYITETGIDLWTKKQ
jgi:hypothetical protein